MPELNLELLGRNGKKPSVLLIEAGEECHRQTRCRNSVANWISLLYSDIDWDFGKQSRASDSYTFSSNSHFNASIQSNNVKYYVFN
jgi:hypothetical protein